MNDTERRTENDRLRRSIAAQARQKAITAVRRLHPDDLAPHLIAVASERPDLPSRQVWAAAARRLCREHWEEFTFYRQMYQAQGELDADYEPAPRGGHSTGRHAKPRQ